MTTQRFNHVALSLPADALDEPGRKEILDFYGDVFGWVELPTMTVDRQRLVLSAHSPEQFVYLVAEDNPMRAPGGDHFGLSVPTMADLDAMLAKAKEWQQRDSRVVLVDKNADDYGVLMLTSFYVRHLLPVMIEVQHFDWHTEAAPASA